MRAGARRRVTIGTTLAVAVLLLLGFPLGASPARAGSPAVPGSLPGPSGAAYSGSNGVVQLTFPSNQPAYLLRSVADPSVEVQQALGGLAEVQSSGAILAFASFNLSDVAWHDLVRNSSTGTTIDWSGQVPVVAASGDWESGDGEGNNSTSLGNVTVQIAFSLNASTSPNPATVAYSLNVSGWPWLSNQDLLGLQVRSNLSPTLGYWQLTQSNLLTAFSRTNSTPLATFLWGGSAIITRSGNQEDQSSVSAYHNLTRDNSSSLVRLSFGAVAGNYSELSYDPWLEVLTPTGLVSQLVAWVITPASLAAIAVGVAMVVPLAAVARRRRRPPESDL